MPQTMYTQAEMSRWGRYLLSEERTDRIDALWKEGDPCSKEERRREIYQADEENWKHQEEQKLAQSEEPAQPSET